MEEVSSWVAETEKNRPNSQAAKYILARIRQLVNESRTRLIHYSGLIEKLKPLYTQYKEQFILSSAKGEHLVTLLFRRGWKLTLVV